MLAMIFLMMLSASSAQNSSYVPGAICAGVDTNGPAQNMLQNKHLKVYDYEWPGFASKDPTAASGWTGLDIDLLVEISARLGFTFEIHEMAQQPGAFFFCCVNFLPPALSPHFITLLPLCAGESWDDMLQRLTVDGDLVLSYWGRTLDKMNTLTMLQAHIDYSPVLVIRENAPTPLSLWDKMLQFSRPFDAYCWIALIAIIVCSGIVDYLLERTDGGTIGASIYEYFAGTLWGGFQDPRSTLSAFYQVMLAFVLLLVISTYTANLAAFLTVKSIPSGGISSIGELVLANEPVCTRTNDPNQAMYEAILHTHLQYKHMDYSMLAGAVRSGECVATIVPRINLDAMLTDGVNCELLQAGGSLMFSSAGWLTNPATAGCVQRPIEMAMQELASEGLLDQLLFKWLPPGACEEEKEETVASRLRQSRRLGSSRGETSTTASMADSSSLRRRGRQLKGAGGSAATAAQEDEDLGIMYFDDFLGILIMWGAMTILILLIRVGQVAIEAARKRRRERAEKVAILADQGEREAAAIKLQSNIRRKAVAKKSENGTLVLDALFGTESSNVPSFNSQASAIRHLVSDVHGVKLMMMEMIKASKPSKPSMAVQGAAATVKTTSRDDERRPSADKKEHGAVKEDSWKGAAEMMA